MIDFSLYFRFDADISFLIFLLVSWPNGMGQRWRRISLAAQSPTCNLTQCLRCSTLGTMLWFGRHPFTSLRSMMQWTRGQRERRVRRVPLGCFDNSFCGFFFGMGVDTCYFHNKRRLDGHCIRELSCWALLFLGTSSCIANRSPFGINY